MGAAEDPPHVHRLPGPCAVGNNALLQLYGRSIWLKDLNDPSLAAAVFDYIETMLAAGDVLAPPDGLRDRAYERYAPPSSAELVQLVDTVGADSSGLDRLDPVCVMEVDPATARYMLEYGGQTIAFCAPSCKKLFLVDPRAYLAV